MYPSQEPRRASCREAFRRAHPLCSCLPPHRRGTLFSDEHVREKAQGYVMLYDMLLGKGTVQGGGKLKVRTRARSTGTISTVRLPYNSTG